MQKLTPVEKYGAIWLKRDDKFILNDVCGGKVRQAIYLIKHNLEKIKTKHNSSVVCSVSLKSPQSAIISSVCKAYGLRCNIVVYKTIKPNINLSIAQDNGANIYGTKSGYTSVLESYAKKYFPNDFYINMGFSSNEVLEANMDQVKNLPKDLDYLVIPIGSAMNFISILLGLVKYNIKPKKIIGIYVGRKPHKVLSKYLFLRPFDIEIVKSEFKYSEECESEIFDPIYEAKAYHWLIRNLDIKNKKVLLWVVGKRNLSYEPKAINYQELKKS